MERIIGLGHRLRSSSMSFAVLVPHRPKSNPAACAYALLTRRLCFVAIDACAAELPRTLPDGPDRKYWCQCQSK